MIAAFSLAISATVLPSCAWWSSPTVTTTATPPSQTLVASSLPPRPTSQTVSSAPYSAAAMKPMAVRSSWWVGSPADRSILDSASSTRSTSSSNRSFDTGSAPRRIRSL